MADYNINAVTRRVVYTGSAGLGPYSFTFEILDENDIAAYFNTTKLTLTTDYTVTINANGTGSITIVTGTNVPSTPTASDTITIVGARDIERTTDFVTAGDLRASALNEQLDGLTIFDQQLAEEQKRTLQAPVTDPAHVDDGGTLDMTLPSKTARAGKYLQFNSTTGNPEAGPDSTDVTTLADIATDIATLADIEDGTDATDAIQTVAGISANVSTVAGIASNVSTVAGIQSDVTAVAADATDIGTVATNIASVNTVAGNISEVIAVANDLNEAVSEVETVANDLNEAVSEIETVAASISNVDTVGTNIANVNTVAGIDSNVTTVAGISGNVTTVAGISGNVTTVAGISADVTTVAADGTDIGTVATNISNVNTVAGISSNVTTVAGNNANVTTVASNIADVNTVASNIADVNNFSSTYRIASSAPATSLDEGDLYFDTTDNQMYVYTGSAWVAVSPDLVADTTPQLGGNLDTNGNDITFGDGDKAIFGAGSDLQIYHDGSNSIISEAGSGNLILQTNGNEIYLAGQSGTEYMLRAVNNGAVELYYDSSKKLATTSGGIDVTGTVTADGLTVDTNTLYVDSANNRVGIGTTSPTNDLHIASASNAVVRVSGTNAGTSTGSILLDGYRTSGDQGVLGGVYFRNQNTTDTTVASIQGWKEGTSAIDLGYLSFYTKPTSGSLTERLRITSGGTVGIGTTVSTGQLNVSKSGGNQINITDSSGSSPGIRFANSSNTALSFIEAPAGNGLSFFVGASEKARLDSSGNLLVGKTTAGIAGAGLCLRGDADVAQFTRSDNPSLQINRLTTDGEIMGIYKDSAQVGAISTASGRIAIGTNDTALFFNDLGDAVVGWNMTTGVSRGSAIDLGTSGVNFKDLYLSGGVYLGGTGASNLLDDYETGTFTPTLTATGGTITLSASTDTMSYTKIGRMVTISGRVIIGSVSGSPTGTVYFSLPFSVVSGAEDSSYAAFQVYTYGVDLATGAVSTFGEAASGSSSVGLLYQVDNAGWGGIDASGYSAGDIIYVNGSYFTT